MSQEVVSAVDLDSTPVVNPIVPISSYPATLPITEIKNIIATLRAGVVPDKRVISKDIWLLAGYLLGQAIGEPNAVQASLAGLSIPPTHDILVALEKIADSPEGLAVLALLPINIGQIIKWTLNILPELF